MLYCDQQCKGCKIWYHYDCLGLSLSDRQRLGASQENFVCPFCIDNSTPYHASPVTSGSAPQLGAWDSTQFKPCTDFLWNNVSGEQVCDFLMCAYDEVVHWRPNVFFIPFGKAGKLFAKEFARLYQAFAEDTALSSIALMGCSVLQPPQQNYYADTNLDGLILNSVSLSLNPSWNKFFVVWL